MLDRGGEAGVLAAWMVSRPSPALQVSESAGVADDSSASVSCTCAPNRISVLAGVDADEIANRPISIMHASTVNIIIIWLRASERVCNVGAPRAYSNLDQDAINRNWRVSHVSIHQRT
jgi:hypothetical protein